MKGAPSRIFAHVGNVSNPDDLRSFGVGDVVHLKSGGPAMTVQSVSVEKGIGCVWFIQHGSDPGGSFVTYSEPQHAWFVSATLELTKKSD